MQKLQLLGKQLCHFAFFFVLYAFLQLHTLQLPSWLQWLTAWKRSCLIQLCHLKVTSQVLEQVVPFTSIIPETWDLLQVLYQNSCNFKVAYWYSWRHSGLMVSALDSRLGGPGSSPGWGHCVVFLGKTLYSHSASLHPGVQMGTSKCAGGNPAMD